jgi:hypothetical protein
LQGLQKGFHRYVGDAVRQPQAAPTGLSGGHCRVLQRSEGQERIDGGYFGGYVKPANLNEDRIDRRFAKNQNGKRKVVVIIRERNGNSVPAVFGSESQAASFIRARIAKGTTVHADETAAWDGLHERFEMKRINHQEAYSLDGACTNWAEEYFSRLRRGEIGIHHHIGGAYLLRYAQESSWREDNRRVSNGDQVNRITHLALKRGKSVDYTGYWQRPITIAGVAGAVVAGEVMIHLRVQRSLGQSLLQRIEQPALVERRTRVAACQ